MAETGRQNRHIAWLGFGAGLVPFLRVRAACPGKPKADAPRFEVRVEVRVLGEGGRLRPAVPW